MNRSFLATRREPGLLSIVISFHYEEKICLSSAGG
jgi:hypothetical protein